MFQVTGVPRSKSIGEGELNRRYFLGIFLVSAATLLLELALTRTLAVAIWYHFSFLVISTALLGFGASGVTLSLWTNLRERAPLDKSLSVLSLGFGVTTILSYWLMQRIPFDPFGLVFHLSQFLFMPLYYLNLVVPFFFSGLVIALLFSRRSKEVNRLYAADLVGAGIGCCAITVVMPVFGGSGSVLMASLLGFLAAAVFGWPQERRVAVAGGMLAVCLLPIAFLGDRLIPISVVKAKRHPLQPAGAKPIYTAWSALSKVDVFKIPAAPERGRPDAGFSIIVDGGFAGTAVPDLSDGARNYLAHTDDFRNAGLAYVGKHHPKVLIIGSGAGREVLEALAFGASSITAVEINPIITKIVTQTLRPSWGGLFEQPEVHLITEDGRSFVRRSQDTYDAIISVQTMSDAALLSGAMSLSETYILTREAFADYYDHLTPEGVLMMTRPNYQIPKLITTTSEMFEERGLQDVARHIFAFRGPVLPYGHNRLLDCFLMKKSVWTPDEIAAMEKRLGFGEPPPLGGKSPELYFSPYEEVPQKTFFNRRLHELANSQDLQAIYRGTSEALSPATDDQPFFNQRQRWRTLRPNVLRRVLLPASDSDINGYLPVAEATLVALFAQAVVIATIFILLPLIRSSRARLRAVGQWSFLVYFAGLGLGFIMVEMVLLQRFTLFLGQPIYTLAVVLAGLLLSSGVGSYATSGLRRTSRWSFVPIIAVILGALGVTAVVTPYVLSAALGLGLTLRVLISLLLIAPLGFVLGMPFPRGLRIVGEEAPELIPWAWGVNGFFTVIGSIAAVILGMAFGFRFVLGIAAACYLVGLAAIILPYALAVLGKRQIVDVALGKNLSGAGAATD
jgi:predicted membrane-bound spermidine synthase